MKIYPGWRKRVVRKDGKLLAFLNQKSKSLYSRGIKAQRLTWTQQWRRRNKKGRTELAAKKKTRRATKVVKAIQGLSIEDLKKRRNQKPEYRQAQRAAALREAKERKKKTKDQKAKSSKNAAHAKVANRAPAMKQKRTAQKGH